MFLNKYGRFKTINCINYVNSNNQSLINKTNLLIIHDKKYFCAKFNKYNVKSKYNQSNNINNTNAPKSVGSEFHNPDHPIVKHKNKYYTPIENRQHSFKNPDNDIFYGLPLSKKIPENEEELINKLTYVNSFNDLFDLFELHTEMFSPTSLMKYLDKINYIYNKELNKKSQQNLHLRDHVKINQQLKEEYQIKLERLNSLITNITNKDSKLNKFGLKDNVRLFQFIQAKFKVKLPEFLSIKIFKVILNNI